MSHHRFALQNGRCIGISSAGDPVALRLVVVCLPTPSAGAFDPDPILTSSAGVHLMFIDRPGSGASDPLPADQIPTIEQCADDIAEYLDYVRKMAYAVSHTSFGPIGVVGWGFGGAVALTLAGRHPALVDRVIVVDTPAPRALRRSIRARRRGLYRGYPLTTPQSLGLDDADPALDGDGVSGRLERMVEEAYRQDEAAIAFDLACLDDRRWARSLQRVESAVTLVYGVHDDLSRNDSRWYQRRLRDAELLAEPSAGNLTIVTGWSRILTVVK